MERSLASPNFWILCSTMPLLLHVTPVHGDQKQTQPAYREPVEYQVYELQPGTKGALADRNSNGPFPMRFRERERLFHAIILKVAGRYQIDPALIKAIILAESEYNPNAISRKGAKGLMQLMPRTARSLGVKNIFDPEHNIVGGVRYLKNLLNQFDGDVKLALASYNAGGSKVRQYRGIPPFKATKRYVKRVFEYYKIYKQQM